MLDVVARYRELGCVDIPVSASKVEGGRARGYRVRALQAGLGWGFVWRRRAAPTAHKMLLMPRNLTHHLFCATSLTHRPLLCDLTHSLPPYPADLAHAPVCGAQDAGRLLPPPQAGWQEAVEQPPAASALAPRPGSSSNSTATRRCDVNPATSATKRHARRAPAGACTCNKVRLHTRAEQQQEKNDQMGVGTLGTDFSALLLRVAGTAVLSAQMQLRNAVGGWVGGWVARLRAREAEASMPGHPRSLVASRRSCWLRRTACAGGCARCGRPRCGRARCGPHRLPEPGLLG